MFEYIWAGDDHPDLRDGMVVWCAERIWPGQNKDMGNCLALGIGKNGAMVAVVIFHNWDAQTGVIEISGASDDKRWLTRRTLWEIYHYAFDTLGCQIVVQRNAEGSHINRMCKAYGFNFYRIPRLRGRDKAEDIMTLTDDDWRSNGFHKEHKHG